MSDATRSKLMPRSLVIGALAVGIVGGSYGIASAASGSSNSTTAATAAPSTAAAPAAATAPAAGTRPAGPPSGQPWGGQRSDETPLTGDALAKVTAVAKAKVPGGTVVRVETDADGNAMYEAHMTNASGTPVTVYVDKSFAFVSLETR